MKEPRTPGAFRVATEERSAPAPIVAASRQPRSATLDSGLVTASSERDDFDAAMLDARDPPPALSPRRRSRIGSIFTGALGLLVSLAVGLWTDRLIRDLFDRAPWLGWFAAGLAGIALMALLIILGREVAALARLGSMERLRSRGADALARDDMKAARGVVDELVGLLAAKPETAAGRQLLASLRSEVVDGADLIRLAETELLAPIDLRARALVLDAAKRVSLVTAVSPRAVVDILYVAFESGRLIRRVAELYGGRPGLFGFIRIARDVLAHLAVTGSIAVGDSFVQQVVGHGLAARLSAKLGEGIVNGMMTARIGIAAMDTARPLAFVAQSRPGLGDFVAVLARFAARQGGDPPRRA